MCFGFAEVLDLLDKETISNLKKNGLTLLPGEKVQVGLKEGKGTLRTWEIDEIMFQEPNDMIVKKRNAFKAEEKNELAGKEEINM